MRGEPQEDKDPLSTRLREATIAIRHRHFEKALTILDRLAQIQALSASRKVQILSAIGDCELDRLDFQSALKAYKKAEQTSGDDPRTWLRPAMAQVRVHLKNLAIEKAQKKAEGILERSVAEQDTCRSKLLWAKARAQAGLTVSFEGLPHRAGMVAFRLGNLFLLEGYIDEAEPFFGWSIVATPKSAKAKIGLAEISLRRLEWPDAHQFAWEAIRDGSFSAKTLPAVPIFLTACVRLGLDPLPAELVRGFSQSASPVRDKAMLATVSCLRSLGREEWTRLAKDYLSAKKPNDEIVRTEVAKLLLSEARRSDLPASLVQARAMEVIESPHLSFGEWSSAAKLLLRAKPPEERSNCVDVLISNAIDQFGPKRASSARHRIARTLIELGALEMAIHLLRKAFEDAPRDSQIWGQARWALGDLLEKQVHHLEAARQFLAIMENRHTEDRFRILATVRWAVNSVKADDLESLLAKKPDFEKAMGRLSDYVILLDSAQQLTKAPRELNSMAPGLLKRGSGMALDLIRKSSDPAEVRKAWYLLTRRWADFRKDKEIVALWQSFSDEQKERIWSLEDRFWEGVGYIFRSYRVLKRSSEAYATAREYITHPSTPPEGHAHLGTLCALAQIQDGKSAEAIEGLEQVILLAPGHVMSAYAYYWLALVSQKTNALARRDRLAKQIPLCVGEAPGLFWQKSLRIRGFILENNLELSVALQKFGDAQSDQIGVALDQIQEDLGRV